jgi:CubicO group peptidase (beta-lactamase class C family)
VEIRGLERDEFLTAGFASLEEQREIEREDRFPIGNVAESFPAAIVMQLVEEEELSLEQAVAEIAPGLGDERVTIRDLLAGRDTLLMAALIEEVTRRSYEEELRDRVLDPLGLEGTTMATGVLPDPHFDGYSYAGDRPSQRPRKVPDAPIDPGAIADPGPTVSTVGDLGTFFEALLAGSLVGRKQVEEMMEPTRGAGNPGGPGRSRTGHGIFGWELSCGEIWGHAGSRPGYRTLGAASPDGEVSVAFVVNATNVPGETEEAILRAQELAICRALGEDAG